MKDIKVGDLVGYVNPIDRKTRWCVVRMLDHKFKNTVWGVWCYSKQEALEKQEKTGFFTYINLKYALYHEPRESRFKEEELWI